MCKSTSQPQAVRPDKGYVTLDRDWNAGDKIDVHFRPAVAGRVGLGLSTAGRRRRWRSTGPPRSRRRRVLVFRGPVILAQFTLSNGCDVSWAYTGDHPDLFDTASAADEIEAADWRFESKSAAALTNVTTTPTASGSVLAIHARAPVGRSSDRPWSILAFRSTSTMPRN